MSFRNNLEYLYERLPGFMRREDATTPTVAAPLFLKRFISFFAGEMDAFDRVVDTLHERVAPETASEEFLNWWLWAFFGWAWFPVWMTLDRKRAFYRDVAVHYARRGTARGIKEFLAAFGITARVFAAPQFHGESTTGEDDWVITGPNVIVVQIYPQTAALAEDLSFYGEWTTGEDVIANPALTVTRTDVDALLRFQQPIGQHIIVVELTAG
jgi:phage tail-like protein